MSRYANKVEKIESGNWVMKSLVLLGGWILGMVVFGLNIGNSCGIRIPGGSRRSSQRSSVCSLPGFNPGPLYGNRNLGLHRTSV